MKKADAPEKDVDLEIYSQQVSVMWILFVDGSV